MPECKTVGGKASKGNIMKRKSATYETTAERDKKALLVKHRCFGDRRTKGTLPGAVAGDSLEFKWRSRVAHHLTDTHFLTSFQNEELICDFVSTIRSDPNIRSLETRTVNTLINLSIRAERDDIAVAIYQYCCKNVKLDEFSFSLLLKAASLSHNVGFAMEVAWNYLRKSWVGGGRKNILEFTSVMLNSALTAALQGSLWTALSASAIGPPEASTGLEMWCFAVRGVFLSFIGSIRSRPGKRRDWVNPVNAAAASTALRLAAEVSDLHAEQVWWDWKALQELFAIKYEGEAAQVCISPEALLDAAEIVIWNHQATKTSKKARRSATRWLDRAESLMEEWKTLPQADPVYVELQLGVWTERLEGLRTKPKKSEPKPLLKLVREHTPTTTVGGKDWLPQLLRTLEQLARGREDALGVPTLVEQKQNTGSLFMADDSAYPSGLPWKKCDSRGGVRQPSEAKKLRANFKEVDEPLLEYVLRRVGLVEDSSAPEDLPMDEVAPVKLWLEDVKPLIVELGVGRSPTMRSGTEAEILYNEMRRDRACSITRRGCRTVCGYAHEMLRLLPPRSVTAAISAYPEPPNSTAGEHMLGDATLVAVGATLKHNGFFVTLSDHPRLAQMVRNNFHKKRGFTVAMSDNVEDLRSRLGTTQKELGLVKTALKWIGKGSFFEKYWEARKKAKRYYVVARKQIK